MLKLRGDVVVRSQKAYIAQAAFEYFVAILVSDAFLAKLLTYMGFSDSLIGIISSLISFSFLFQLFTIAMIPRIKNIKRTVVIFDTVSQLFFAGIYVVPFLRCGIHIKAAIVIGCLLAAYFLKYLISTVFSNGQIRLLSRRSAALILQKKRWYRWQAVSCLPYWSDTRSIHLKEME